MPPQASVGVAPGPVAQALHYEITHLWNGDLIQNSDRRKINPQITLQSKNLFLSTLRKASEVLKVHSVENCSVS